MCASPLLLCGQEKIPPARSEQPRVLVINSYHPGYNWSDGEQAALLQTLGQSRPNLLPCIEYLDWRRFPSPERVATLLTQLEQKYGRQAFDLIVTLDDPAVDFALQHRDFFGAKVPVVFGGVNDFEPDYFRTQHDVTGVIQNHDFLGTLNLIHRLQPGVTKIAAVHCQTESGIASRRSLERLLAQAPQPFTFDWVEGWTAESLLQRLGALPDNTAVLIVSIYRNEAGRVLADDENFGRALAARSRVPVYFVAPPMVRHFGRNTWDDAVWQGLGGSLLAADLHGELVARLALRVLGGEPAGSIPIITESPARLAVDYIQLERFGLSTGALPAGTQIYHAPPSFYQVHRSRIIGGIVLIVVLGATVVLLVAFIMLRRRGERALRRSHEHFQLMARATNDAVWDWDLTRDTLWWNEGYTRQLQLSRHATQDFQDVGKSPSRRGPRGNCTSAPGYARQPTRTMVRRIPGGPPRRRGAPCARSHRGRAPRLRPAAAFARGPPRPDRPQESRTGTAAPRRRRASVRGSHHHPQPRRRDQLRQPGLRAHHRLPSSGNAPADLQPAPQSPDQAARLCPGQGTRPHRRPVGNPPRGPKARRRRLRAAGDHLRDPRPRREHRQLRAGRAGRHPRSQTRGPNPLLPENGGRGTIGRRHCA